MSEKSVFFDLKQKNVRALTAVHAIASAAKPVIYSFTMFISSMRFWAPANLSMMNKT